MIITIAGHPGAGKTTVGNLLAKKLGFEHFSLGDLKREAAKKHKMTIHEYNELGAKDPSIDHELDKYQEALGKSKDNFVIDGRTSFLFIPQSVKLYLDVNPSEAARRIASDGARSGENNNKDLARVRDDLVSRKLFERSNFKRLYKVDCHDPKNYDFVLNTTEMTPLQVVKEILAFLKEKGHNI